VGRFFSQWGASAPRTETGEQLALCALQLLKAVRIVVDQWVETLEKRSRPRARRRATKIKVQ
jgi:hypothetical protein